jgi:hypothetical protein
MKGAATRRQFVAAGIALPVAGSQPAQAAPLARRKLGNTGLEVTPLGFGCMLVSDPSVVAQAVDMGLNLYDTARAYQNGNNERMVGAVLGGRRKKAILQSKSAAKTKAAALSDLDTSLKELGTDYLDVWYLHDKNQPEEVSDDLLEAQHVAKQAGKIRFAGVSTHCINRDIIPWLVQRGQTDVILITYNFAMPAEMRMDESIRKARAAGIGIIAMKVMAGGYARLKREPDLMRRLLGNADTQASADTLLKLGAMPAALKWVLRNRDVDSAIVGITDTDQLEENVAAMRTPFGDADRKALTAQLDAIGPLYCRMCGSCEGVCPRNLPVSTMLRILSYADGYGQFPLARERFRKLPESVTRVRCKDCAECAVRCPNGVHVPERLVKAQEWLA